jgi:hypothetical protein
MIKAPTTQLLTQQKMYQLQIYHRPYVVNLGHQNAKGIRLHILIRILLFLYQYV